MGNGHAECLTTYLLVINSQLATNMCMTSRKDQPPTPIHRRNLSTKRPEQIRAMLCCLQFLSRPTVCAWNYAPSTLNGKQKNLGKSQIKSCMSIGQISNVVAERWQLVNEAVHMWTVMDDLCQPRMRNIGSMDRLKFVMLIYIIIS